MSKVRNKIINNRLKKQKVKQVEVFNELKQKMQRLIEAEDYVAAMDVMAEMAVNRKIDAEVMYWGAMCYFRTGDYGRAVKWINNALTYNSTGVKERSLLAAICIGNGRYEDGIRVMDKVLSENGGEIAESDRKFMLEAMEPVRYGHDDLLCKYLRVKELLDENMIVYRRPAEDKVEDKASSALAKLRSLLDKTKRESAIKIIEKSEKNIEPEPEIDRQPLADKPEESLSDSFDTVGTMQQIMEKEISLREKIKLLNAFAAGCYQSGDYQAAFDLLNGALQLDAYAPEILRNMAYVCLAAGENEQASEYAAKLPMADFGLLYALKNS